MAPLRTSEVSLGFYQLASLAESSTRSKKKIAVNSASLLNSICFNMFQYVSICVNMFQYVSCFFFIFRYGHVAKGPANCWCSCCLWLPLTAGFLWRQFRGELLRNVNLRKAATNGLKMLAERDLYQLHCYDGCFIMKKCAPVFSFSPL